MVRNGLKAMLTVPIIGPLQDGNSCNHTKSTGQCKAPGTGSLLYMFPTYWSQRRGTATHHRIERVATKLYDDSAAINRHTRNWPGCALTPEIPNA